MPCEIANSRRVLCELGGSGTVSVNAGALPLPAEYKAASVLIGLDAGSSSELVARQPLGLAGHEHKASPALDATATDNAPGSLVVRILRMAVANANGVSR